MTVPRGSRRLKGMLTVSRGLSRGLACGLVFVGSLIACGSDDSSGGTTPTKSTAQASSGCGKTGAPSGLQSSQSIQVDGAKRTYELFVGSAHDGKTPLPLVFILHGGGGTGAGVRKSFDIESVANGKAIFVYPDATNKYPNSWDLDDNADKNPDIKLFDALRASIASSYCVDSQRVFAWGSSAGAYFANQLACRRGGELRAIAANSGGAPYGGDDKTDKYDDSGNLICPESPTAALIIHGTSDGTVDVSEGKAALAWWRKANGCAAGDGTDYDPSPCKALAGCNAARPVVGCFIPGMGHTIWPEHGTDVTWKFFSSL